MRTMDLFARWLDTHPGRAGTVRNLVRRVVFWMELAESRRRLRQLDERMLRDIGVDRADAEREARRPFWEI